MRTSRSRHAPFVSCVFLYDDVAAMGGDAGSKSLFVVLCSSVVRLLVNVTTTNVVVSIRRRSRSVRLERWNNFYYGMPGG